MEGLRGAGERLVGITRDQQRHSGRGVADRTLVDERGPGARVSERVEIFAIVEKRQILGPSAFERSNVGKQPFAAFRVSQGCPAQRRQRIKRKWPGSIKEAGV